MFGDFFLFVFVCEEFSGLDYMGKVFCYFLFLIYSGLFVYVNGVFVVVLNRWNLKEIIEDDKVSIGVEWNNVLL